MEVQRAPGGFVRGLGGRPMLLVEIALTWRGPEAARGLLQQTKLVDGA